jgi:hypothetical protein
MRGNDSSNCFNQKFALKTKVCVARQRPLSFAANKSTLQLETEQTPEIPAPACK